MNLAEFLSLRATCAQFDASSANGGRCSGAHPVSAIKAADEILRFGLIPEERKDFSPFRGGVVASGIPGIPDWAHRSITERGVG